MSFTDTRHGKVHSWANIHLDLLNEIAKQLYSYDDYLRLRFVCKDWDLKVQNILVRKIDPWLVLPGVDETFEARHLEEKKICHLILPEMHDNFIRGSCFGWLISVVISNGAVQMLNPFTKAHFDLPPCSTFPIVISDKHCDEYELFDARDEDNYFVERIRHHQLIIHKVVLSSPPSNDNDDFMAVAVYGWYSRLAFCRLHDKEWTDIPTEDKEPEFKDVMFFPEKIYAIDFDAQLHEFDTKSKPWPVGGINKAVSPPNIRDNDVNVCMNKYLIGRANGSFLLVARHVGEDSAHKFDVFTLHKDAKEWSKIYSVRNYTLMISTGMLAHAYTNMKENHIYYTDNQADFHHSDIASYHDIGIFNLEGGIITKLLPTMKFLCPPVWLLP